MSRNTSPTNNKWVDVYQRQAYRDADPSVVVVHLGLEVSASRVLLCEGGLKGRTPFLLFLATALTDEIPLGESKMISSLQEITLAKEADDEQNKYTKEK